MNNLVRLSLIALFVACALSAVSQEIVHARRLPDIDFREAEKLDLPEDREPRRAKVHRFLPPFRLPAFSANAVSAAAAPARAALAAPRLALGFTSGTSRQVDPADASGAVGKTHIVGAYNAGVVIHHRDGTIAGSSTMRQFWSWSQVLGDQYDPRIAYDSINDRFIMIAVDREEALLIAVSETGDPTGTWRRFDANLTDSYVDFTHIALTKNRVMLMTNVGSSQPEAAVILSIKKSDLYSGSSNVPMRKYYTGLTGIVPVHGESTTTEYVVSLSDGSSSILVTELENLHTGQNWRFVSAPSWVDNARWIVPQLGTSMPLTASYFTLEAAVYRNNSIFVTFTGTIGFDDVNAAVFCRFHPTTLDATWGAVWDPAGVTHYAYPSIAANDNGAFVLGFGSFSEKQYPAAEMAYVDMFGRVSKPRLIRAGDTPFKSNDRWGDYTTTVADPLEPESFWTVQICTNQGQWGTVWGKIEEAPGKAGNKRRSARH